MTAPSTSEARQLTRRMPCSICATWPGAEEIRRAAVACRPSCSTDTTSKVFIIATSAPYAPGPSMRAAIIVKP
jgi:hypothetical protein